VKTRTTLVVLEVLDDTADREWWEALGLPAPWRWSEAFPGVFVEEKAMLVRHDTPLPPPVEDTA
jgi:hypothetical protein